MKKLFKNNFRDKPIGFKLASTFIFIIILPMLLLAYISYVSSAKRLEDDAHAKMDLSLTAALKEYNERGEQMRYGMLQISAAGQLKDAMLRRKKDQIISILRALSEARPYVDLWLTVDKEKRVTGRLNNNNTGDVFEINGLVKKALLSGEQQMSTEILAEDISNKEGDSFLGRHAPISITSGISPDEYKRDGMKEERRLMALIVVTPVFNKTNDIIGALIAGDILNNDNHVPDALADIQDINASISMDGLRIATRLKDHNGQSAIGTLLPASLMTAIKSGKAMHREWSLFGKGYLSAYDLIKDHKGNIIGSIDVAIPKEIIFKPQKDNLAVVAIVAFAAIGLSLLFAFIATRKITMPLRLLKDKANDFARGDAEAIVEIERSSNTRDEIGILANTFNFMTGEVKRRIQEKENAMAALEKKNDELYRLNEKLAETNEELEVTLEELQSQTEEVQSTNEELRILNEEMDRKNIELIAANMIIKEEEGELRKATNKLRLIYDNITDYILLVDREHVVLEANRSFIESLGPRKSSVTGSTLCSLLGIEDPLNDCPARIAHDYAGSVCEINDPLGDCPIRKAILTLTPVDMEMTIDEKVLQWHALPLLRENGEPDIALACVKDVTEQIRLMRKLIHSDKLASLGELVSGVAHELNNPLTAIMGFSELLLAEDIDEKMKNRADRIHTASKRCKRIVENLLTFSRWNKPEKTYQDINDIIAKTVELKAYNLRAENIEISLGLDPSLPKTMVDGHQLQQVFLNLLNNSQHAVNENNREKKISIDTHYKNDKICIEFSDTGIGIPEGIISRIFDPFFTTKDAGKGTGLGLSISYGIIGEHDGTMLVKSSPGKGTTFLIELPVVRGNIIPQTTGLIQDNKNLLTDRKLRALILDDEPLILDFFKEVLIMSGHTVDTTGDGEEALKMLEKTDRNYDIVISDLKMPHMNGKEFYCKVKALKPEVADRIIFISGDTSSMETQDFLNKTGALCLIKPINISQLKELIAKFVSE